MAASSSDAADDFDLYGDIDISTQLPSHVELERSLEEAVARRTGLQAELQSLQQQFAAGKPRVEDLTRRMCILLQTAQLEIKRKEDQLDALRAPSARRAPQAATLAAEQKQLLGERLFPLVQAVEPHLAGKITGMLLEMDSGELLALLEEPEALNAKVAEARTVLHQQPQPPQPQPQPQSHPQPQPQPQPQRRAPPASRSPPDQRHEQRRRERHDDRRRSRSRSPDRRRARSRSPDRRRRGRSRSRSPTRRPAAAHTQGPRSYTGRTEGERQTGARHYGDRGRFR